MEKLSEKTLVPKYMQEYDLDEECEELLTTLPSEKCWNGIHLHQYQGFWFAPEFLQAVISCQKHFQAFDTDILLVTSPKAGTTWLKALSFALINRNKYPNIHSNHPLLTKNPHELVPFGRDPKDVFVSFWHFISNVRSKRNGTLPLEEAFECFCRGVCPFGPFWEHVLGYWKKSLESSNKLSNLEVNKTEKVSFNVENKYFFRLGQIGDWKNHLTTEMIEHINSITKQKLANHGLSF
ncbi:hypothetical protein KIW84_043630 [Lathyrus oleraceus]|uniref:Sulfotransferase n=1 Tax=Pisum sativum TaxID=3888 RepID=A0A9D4XE68_PEA|nr:hypothetical protein KIW84_043630 [Pisum sativum]